MKHLVAAPFCALMLSVSCYAQSRGTTRPERWQADITQLDSEFTRRQIDVFGRVSRHAWQTAIAGLRALPVERLSDAEIAWQIEHLLALYHDGHIKILADGSSAEPLFLPVRFR